MPKKIVHHTVPWKKLLVTALATATVGSGAVILKNIPLPPGEKVVEVVDGDTFIIENRQPIRLFGLDAPALGYCLGQEARKALTKLVLGKRVHLKEPLSDGRGRIMAFVYTDGVFVNETMIKAGLADYRQGGSKTDTLGAANTYARSNEIGIYSPVCYQTQPPDPACAIKGNYNEHDRVHVYFTPECNNYTLVKILLFQGDQWFCSEKEAENAGFTKSKNCRQN